MDGAEPILTIGYQGSSPAALLATLTGAGVRTVIDVRAVPWSRRPAFTKRALAAAVAEAGLRYVHLAGLGNPARTDHTGGPDMAAHLAAPAGRAALDAASALVAEAGPVVLLCLERDPAGCHRRAVAAALAARTGAPVRHLTGPAGDARPDRRPDPRPDPRQGVLFR
ncbi:DUF488 family protein [Roseospira goensis]|uniref:Uncharacterized protein (DUF488 family) n=1 Tax=Roseospira goensis TaxID=391922 RepID=A0A7W6RZD1_9PROT|nr:DUF488 domain-containing protein [Roseospira goensis]MBB4285342.1 uncharacterized protein (DUF488 family) [Roseospira goensis]